MYTTNTVVLATILCAAPVMPLAGQSVHAQAQDSVRVAPATSARDSSTSLNQTGPRLSASFQTAEPYVARSNTLGVSPLPQEGDRHTFVISTLGLVLIAIIIVLLIR